MDNVPVFLSNQEWQQVMAILGDAPWKYAHPLLMKMGEQLRQQAERQRDQPNLPPRRDSKEAVQ